MKKIHPMQEYHTGITLIEVLVYIALFSFIIGSATVSVWNVSQSSGRDQTSAEIEIEGNFLLEKIGWVMGVAQSISAPAVNSTGPALSIIPYNISLGSPLLIATIGHNVTLTRGPGPVGVLNSTDIQVQNFSYTHTPASSTTFENVSVHFILSERTDTGATVSQDFSEIYYLKP